MPIEIIVADDRDIIRNAIRRLLSSDADINIVAEAESLADAMRLSDELKPNLVVMDLYMTQSRTTQDNVADRIAKSIPRWIAVSFANDEAAQKLAAECGAIQLLDKVNLSNELATAIRSSALNPA
jgi:NarL family two-component system response regulator LiaR